jgi:hypothetical protein
MATIMMTQILNSNFGSCARQNGALRSENLKLEWVMLADSLG